MNKDISKAIMDRIRLRHKFLRSQSIEDRKAYNKQRNYCVSLIRKIMNAFFNAQFSYCPLTWIFHIRKLNNKINKWHERCLRIIYNNNTSTYEELLEDDNSVSVHFRNVQALAFELYKVVNRFSPDIMKDVFPLNANSFYNTRNKRMFHSRHIRTFHFGSEMLSHLAPKILELVLEEIKELESVTSFKNAIKKWKLANCPCRLC